MKRCLFVFLFVCLQCELQRNMQASARHLVWPSRGFSADPPTRPLSGKQGRAADTAEDFNHVMTENFLKWSPWEGKHLVMLIFARRRQWGDVMSRPTSINNIFYIIIILSGNGERRRLSANKDSPSENRLSGSNRKLCEQKKKSESNSNCFSGRLYVQERAC